MFVKRGDLNSPGPCTVSFVTCRKSSARVIEELQRTLIEVETRYKTEISRLKKKYESDIRELEGALDNANRANAEYLKQIKSLQLRVKVRNSITLSCDQCQYLLFLLLFVRRRYTWRAALEMKYKICGILQRIHRPVQLFL